MPIERRAGVERRAVVVGHRQANGWGRSGGTRQTRSGCRRVQAGVSTGVGGLQVMSVRSVGAR